MTPFHWLEDATVAITTGNASANVALKKVPTGDFQIEVYNAFTSPIFIRKGTDSTVTASATDKPVAPGAMEVLTINNNPYMPVTFIAAISPSGSGTIYFTTGGGI